MFLKVKKKHEKSGIFDTKKREKMQGTCVKMRRTYTNTKTPKKIDKKCTKTKESVCENGERA